MEPVDASSGPDPFPDTNWDRLQDVGWFCEQYRKAVREYLRRRVGPEDASDICQDFFAGKVMRDGILGKVDRNRGTLRAFLVATLNNLVRQRLRSSRAQKRGGGFRAQSLVDGMRPEGAVPLHGSPPDRLHDLCWAHDLLEGAILETEAWCRGKGRAEEFAALRPILDGSGPVRGYGEIAAELGVTPGDVASALRRLRLRVGRYVAEKIEERVGECVLSADEFNEFRRILEDRT